VTARPGRTGLIIAAAMTAVAVPSMLGLGAWQLQRRDWKHAQLAALARASTLPPVRVAGPLPAGLGFRTAVADVRCPSQAAEPRAGRSADGASGFGLWLRCTADGAPLTLVAGWMPPSALPALKPVAAFQASLSGRLLEDQGRYHFYAATLPSAVAAAGASSIAAPPTVESIPDNHLSYALQWFSFAAVWAIIAGLWMRGRVAALRRGG
jgi:cytochrome oxidase assembly protein ShyY1